MDTNTNVGFACSDQSFILGTFHNGCFEFRRVFCPDNFNGRCTFDCASLACYTCREI